jgi:osmotically-inducible protein OsmY
MCRSLLIPTLFVSLALLGCNQSNPLNKSTASNDNHTTAFKPAIGGGETPATSATSPTAHSEAPPQADNTAVNQRDRDHNAVTPLSQGNSQKDLNMTAEIRKRILRNTEMSADGQNVKIITLNGKVTLRGPVASEAERKIIEQIAHDVAGPDMAVSELEVINKK